MSVAREAQGSTNWAFCVGMIAGIADVMRFDAWQEQNGMDPSGVLKGEMLCAPAVEPSLRDEYQAFLNWEPKHPELWVSPDFGGVVNALAETWPC